MGLRLDLQDDSGIPGSQEFHIKIRQADSLEGLLRVTCSFMFIGNVLEKVWQLSMSGLGSTHSTLGSLALQSLLQVRLHVLPSGRLAA